MSLDHTFAPSAAAPPPGVLFWFRQDLRLHDQLALAHAAALAEHMGGWLLPVHVHDTGLHALTPWGFERTGAHRLAWTDMAVQGLSASLQALDSTLLRGEGDPLAVLAELAHALQSPWLVCEEIAAPEEEAQVQALRRRGLHVQTVWQSTLVAPEALPLPPEALPDTFTPFRLLLERHGVQACAPIPAPTRLPALPPEPWLRLARERCVPPRPRTPAPVDARAAFPWGPTGLQGSEQAALAHLQRYCARGLPHRYKATRNGLDGVDDSSKWSPWLATGALSARTAWAAVADFAQAQGANEGTEWLLFELLWRDHFRWLHRKHGRRLYRARGLSHLPPPPHQPEAFARWCHGESGNAFIDAGMRELAATGHLSNRMRQNVASWLIHDLGCDWRAGAAWFEARLIDHDVYSNQGNWLYLSGRGTDPRPHRRFNPEWQAQRYDPEGRYRQKWAA
jgi:deoxyribodipyrimidine photo-lyase